jgi:thioesterase domain-containing protein
MAYRQDMKKAKHIQRWKDMADEVDVHETPGSHSSMYDKPHVQVLAHLVQAECDKVAGIFSPRRKD